MTCPLSIQLTNYREGRLGPVLDQEMQQHLGQCLECRRLHQEIEQVSRLLRNMAEEAAPAPSLVRPRSPRGPLRWMATASLLGLLGTAAAWTFRQPPPPPQLVYQDQHYTVTVQGQDTQLLELRCTDPTRPELRLQFR